MSQKFTQISLLTLASLTAFATPSFALDEILRPYSSTRNVGMGGVRITTGLYDENFFNNPARVTANPRSRFTLMQLMPVDINSAAISNGNTIISGGDALRTISQAAGKNIHDRTQLILPAYYLASTEDRKWSLAIGLIASVQANADLRQSYQMSFLGVADIGPAITFGRKFLKDDSLSVGVTGHFMYRMATNPNYSLVDYVRGSPISFNTLGGEGALVDFDLGGTYAFANWAGLELSVGGAVQNLLGGSFTTVPMKLFNFRSSPPAQPRSFGFGVSATRESWAFLKNITFAIESTDIANSSGSFFKTLHVGGEAHWSVLALRAGLNQGYWTAGLGVDLRFLTLDFATYGEEMGQNTGILEDRRYSFTLGLHI